MNRRTAIRRLATFFLTTVSLAEAQQPTKIPRIGFLLATSPAANAARIEGFRQGLRELGYLEGKNIIIEWRYAEEKPDRLLALAAELVRLKVDIIVTGGASSTRAAKKATTTIPIVMAQDPDPVATGVVASLARPGGNITGLSALAPELSGKRLEILKETVPKLSRVAVLGISTIPDNAQSLKEMQLAGGVLRVQLQFLDVLSSKDIEIAFREARKGRADAVLVLQSPVASSHRAEIVDLAVKSRLPAIYPQSDYYGRWWPHVLWREHYRSVPPRGYVCGQDFERQAAH
jgi:putative ABC transport system substrate-binding protein